MVRRLRRILRVLAGRGASGRTSPGDPRTDLETAIAAAREAHGALVASAAGIIANQIQAERRLDRAIEEHARVTGEVRAALSHADAAERDAHPEDARRWSRAATAGATRLIGLEAEIRTLRTALVDATAAADRARDLVLRNAEQVRAALADRERLLSRLDQAEMQEQLNAARAMLRAAPDGDAVTVDQLRRGIDQRLAVAQALAEIRADPYAPAADPPADRSAPES